MLFISVISTSSNSQNETTILKTEGTKKLNIHSFTILPKSPLIQWTDMDVWNCAWQSRISTHQPSSSWLLSLKPQIVIISLGMYTVSHSLALLGKGPYLQFRPDIPSQCDFLSKVVSFRLSVKKSHKDQNF